MQDASFYRFGKVIHRFRWAIILTWLMITLCCIPFLPHIIAPFTTTGFIDEHSSSARAEEALTKAFGYNYNNKVLIIYHSKTLLATSNAFKNKIKKSLAALKQFSIPLEIIFPGDKKQLISKNKHSAYVVIIIKTKQRLSNLQLDEFKSLIKKPTRMTMELGGESIFVQNVNQQTQKDLYRSDLIATPVSIIILLMVFGSVFAAVIPVLLGGACALIILTTLYFLGHLFTLSIFTLNIALLLGLCLSLDYSLFIISRFRDELKENTLLIDAISKTQASAGKAILFSGLTVFASLSALLLFPINILFSVAVGGLTAVSVAVITAIVVLPAILAVVNTKIDLLTFKRLRSDETPKLNFWGWLAEKVLLHPRIYFVGIVVFLLVLGYPFLSARFSVSDYRIFPPHSAPRQFYDDYARLFNQNELSPILLIVQSQKPILAKRNLAKLYDLTDKLKKEPLIKEVNSIVTTDPRLTKEQYNQLYHLSADRMNKETKQLLATTTTDHLTVVSLISRYDKNSPQMGQLIETLRAMPAPKGMSVQLVGVPVSNYDLLKTISHIVPYAILWIMVFTYFILLILLRSIFLPLKAIIMNILSLSAAYGALVLVFQDGYLHNYLNFEPQGILDISLIIIIFCALFGFSMDYEVFLLSRIKESYDSSLDNEKSIVFGIEKSCRIITSAAIIVISLCASFLVADVLMVKAFGMGIAVAIFVDAFLIRIILVPATMIMLKKWNWYIPRWLDKLLG